MKIQARVSDLDDDVFPNVEMEYLEMAPCVPAVQCPICRMSHIVLFIGLTKTGAGHACCGRCAVDRGILVLGGM